MKTIAAGLRYLLAFIFTSMEFDFISGQNCWAINVLWRIFLELQ